MQAFFNGLLHTSSWLFFPTHAPYENNLWLLREPFSWHQVGPNMALHFESEASLQVLQFHGNAKNLNEHVYFLKPWLALGLDVWGFDYRGFGGSQGRVSLKNAIKDGVRILQSLPPKDTLIFCQSIGVPICLMSTAKWVQQDPSVLTRIKGFVLEGGFFSPKEVVQSILSNCHLSFLRHLFSERHTPSNALQHLSTIPAVLVHGEEDEMIPIHLGEQLYEVYPGPKLWINSPYLGHLGHINRHQGFIRWIEWLLDPARAVP